MKLVPVDRFEPAPTHDFLSYPGASPDSSFVLTSEGIILLTDADPLSEAQSVLRTLGSTPIEERFPVLCAGSNANPPQALEKIRKRGHHPIDLNDLNELNGLDDRNVAFLLAEVPGVQAVFSAHIGTYGVVPATLDEAPGVTETFFVGFYTRRQLESLIASEHGNYDLATMPSAASGTRLIQSDTRLPAWYFFQSRKGVLVLGDREPIPLDRYSQAEILALLFEELSSRESLPTLANYLAAPAELGPVLAQAIDRAGFWRRHRLDADPVEQSELLAGCRVENR